MPKKLISRKIRYYHLRMQQQNIFNPTPKIDIPYFLQKIDQLPFDIANPSHSRYWRDPQSSRTYCCWVDQIKPEQCHVRFGKIRQDDLPQIERQGQLNPLSLESDEGIAEIMHVIFFPDGIIGAEHNYFGPRMRHLLQYLMSKLYQECPNITADLLLKKDAAQKLQEMEGITFLRLKVVSSYIGAIKEADSYLGAAFEAAFKAGEPDIVEVVLQNRGKHALLDRTKEAIQILFRRRDFREEVEKAEIKGLNEDDEDVDILSDKLILSREFNRVSNKVRQVVSQEMYDAIDDGHTQLRDELLSTAGVEI